MDEICSTRLSEYFLAVLSDIYICVYGVCACDVCGQLYESGMRKVSTLNNYGDGEGSMVCAATLGKLCMQNVAFPFSRHVQVQLSACGTNLIFYG